MSILTKFDSFLKENKHFDEYQKAIDNYDMRIKSLMSFTDRVKNTAIVKKTKIINKELTNRLNDIDKGRDGDENSKFIYHYTDIYSLYNIIRKNVMYGDTSISFTSDSNLYRYRFWLAGDEEMSRDSSNTPVKIKFDFTLMKSDGLIFSKSAADTEIYEYEIRLESLNLRNVTKYILEVIMIDSKIKKDRDLLDSLEGLLISKEIKYKFV